MNNLCEHQCSGNCRREGCNCLCGEYHEEQSTAKDLQQNAHNLATEIFSIEGLTGIKT